MLVSQARPGQRARGLRRGAKLHLVQDRFGYALKLAELLGKQGFSTRSHVHADMIPDDAEAVLFTAPLIEAANTEEAEQALTTLIETFSRLDASLKRAGGFIGVATHTGQLGFEDGEVTQSPYISLSPLLRELGQRWPEAGVKLIDLDARALDDETLASQIVEELISGGDEVVVCIDAQLERRCVKAQPAPTIKPDPHHISARDLLILSGLDAAQDQLLLEELIGQTSAKLLWLSPEPTPWQRALAQQHATRLTLAQVNTRDFGALFELLYQQRRAQGAITGMILGSGVDQVQLGVLMASTAGDDLRSLLFLERHQATSELAAQADHAKRYALAHRERQRRGPSCAVTALSLGPELDAQAARQVVEVLRWPDAPAQLSFRRA